MTVSAHELVQSRDCVFPMCTNEAEVGDHCLKHSEEARLRPARAVGTGDDVIVRPCRVQVGAGVYCGEEASDSPTKGAYANKCKRHREEETARRRGAGRENGVRVGSAQTFRERAQRLVAVGTKLDRALAQREKEAPGLERRRAMVAAAEQGLEGAVARALLEWRKVCRELAGDDASAG